MSLAPAHANSGRSSASPRRWNGSDAGAVSHPLSARPPEDSAWDGKIPSTRPGTATTSHSSPLAACAVMTWTASGSGSRTGMSRPRSWSSATPSQARNAPSVATSADWANDAATSRNASRCSRPRRLTPGAAAPPPAGARTSASTCAVATSTSSPRARSAWTTSSGSERYVRPRSSRSSLARAVRRRWPPDDSTRPSRAARPGSGRSSRASTIDRWSTTSPSITVGAPPSAASSSAAVEAGAGRPPSARARSAAHDPRACRSAAPSATRGPVSSRSSESPRDGSCTASSSATTSTTSGVDSRPPRPTTSTGRPRRRSATSTAANCDRARHSTAAVTRSEASGRDARRQRAATNSATASASSSLVAATCARTPPAPAPGRRSSGGTSTPVPSCRACSRRGAAATFAAPSTAASLRHDVLR